MVWGLGAPAKSEPSKLVAEGLWTYTNTVVLVIVSDYVIKSVSAIKFLEVVVNHHFGFELAYQQKALCQQQINQPVALQYLEREKSLGHLFLA